jgi:methionine biosynthesis protein MetW
MSDKPQVSEAISPNRKSEIENRKSDESPVSEAISQDRYYDDYWSGVTGWTPTDTLGEDLKLWIDRLVERDQTILDVGCGDGTHYGGHLVKAGIDLYGVDISEVAVRSSQDQGLKAQTANLEKPLPFEDGKFDAAICLEVLEHLVDPEYTAREVFRILRPGGKFLVSVPNVASWRSRAELLILGHFNPNGSPLTARRYPWRDPHLRFFSSRALSNMLTDVGFEVVRQGGLETQFLSTMPVLRDLVRQKFMRPADIVLRGIGRRFYRLLAGRCVILVRKPTA